MPTNTYHIAAIGPAELVSGLQAVGVTVFAATNAAAASEHLMHIRTGETAFGCVFITESIMLQMDPEVVAGGKDADSLPVILTIPDLQSSKDSGLAKLRELTKRAIGSDILGG